MINCLIVDDDEKLLQYVSSHLEEKVFKHILSQVEKHH